MKGTYCGKKKFCEICMHAKQQQLQKIGVKISNDENSVCISWVYLPNNFIIFATALNHIKWRRISINAILISNIE